MNSNGCTLSHRSQFSNTDGMHHSTTFQFDKIADLTTHIAAIFDDTSERIHIRLRRWCILRGDFEILSPHDQFNRFTMSPFVGVLYPDLIVVIQIDADHVPFFARDNSFKKI